MRQGLGLEDGVERLRLTIRYDNIRRGFNERCIIKILISRHLDSVE